MGEYGGRVQQRQLQPATEPQGPLAFRRPAREVARGRAATAAAQGQGAPLQPDVRREFEHRLGHDFGAVRVHTGNEAERATAALGASGFTLGRNVVLGGGVSDQASPMGRRILAHELRHVVQQAGFLDRDLGGAPVLDASHPSEHEARAATSPLTPLAAPAIQRGPLDLRKSGGQLVVDLSKKNWREALEFAGGETKVVYVLRDSAIEIKEKTVEVAENVFEKQMVEDVVTNEYMKVGKTTVSKVFGRFEKYATAGRKWGRHLYADVWTFRKPRGKTAEMVEAEIRAGMERTNARLRWDNTNRRLGRGGKGIPDPKAVPEGEEEELTAEELDRIEKEIQEAHARGAAPSVTEHAGESAEKQAEGQADKQVEKQVEKQAEKPAENVASKGATTAAEATEGAAEKTAAEAAAEAAAAQGVLRAGVVGTALEVAFNPALMFGSMVLEGISGDYQAAWKAIKAPARVRGFAQGMAARFAGLDGHAALMMITPDFVNATMGAAIVGAEGMEEQALVDGAREGWKYADATPRLAQWHSLRRTIRPASPRRFPHYINGRPALCRASMMAKVGGEAG